MEELKFIRELYHPIQPAVTANHRDIHYYEMTPAKPLENLIYCIWQLKTKRRLRTDFHYRVVADGCIDIFFDLTNTSESFVMGFHRKFFQFPIGLEFNYIGVRFYPSVFPMLFGLNAKLLADRTLELEKVLPSFSEWISLNISVSSPVQDIVDALGNRVEDHLKSMTIRKDYRFLDSLRVILINNGFLKAENNLNIGLSPRHLRRIFNFYLGTTPKSFCNVVRFQSILRVNPSMQVLRESKAYYDVGFFDQSHFIKDFKRFYGVTPSEAFR